MIRVAGPASPYDPTYHLLARFHKIAEIVRQQRPDVLEIHSPYLAAVGALRADSGNYGVRTFQWHSDFIDTYAGVLEHTLRGASPLLSRLAAPAVRPAIRPLWQVVRAIAARCDATLVASRWQADKLRARGAERVTYVPFGIERSVFRPEARSPEARAKLLTLVGRAGSDVPIFVGVGRFAIEKRWETVLEAFRRLRRSRDAVLILLGDGPERERMQQAAKTPDVAMPGFIRDRGELAAMLASADALVHACPFETFGLSIAEALSAGLPIVVPDEGGAAEMHADAAGERYLSGCPEACAAAMARLLDRLSTSGRELRIAAAESASALPDVQGQFRGQVALYTELLERRTSARSVRAR